MKTVKKKYNDAKRYVKTKGKAFVNKAKTAVKQTKKWVKNKSTQIKKAAVKAVKSTAKFVKDNKEAIKNVVIATGVVVAAAAVLTISGGTAAPIIAAMAQSALMGGVIATGITAGIDAMDGKMDLSFKDYVGAFVGGCYTGALMGVGAGVIGATGATGSLATGLRSFWAGSSAMAGNSVQQSISKGYVDGGELLVSGFTAGLMSYGAEKATPYISKFLSPKVATNTGITGNADDFINNADDVVQNQTEVQKNYNKVMKAMRNNGSGNGKIYFGQKGVSPNFSKAGKFKGESIDSVANKLRNGILSPNELPIEYVVRDGKMITLNNRSLTALSKAKINQHH